MDTAPAVLTLDEFEPLVGRSFSRIDAPDGPVFRLVAANALKTQDYPGRQRDAFALTFEAEMPEAQQGMRTFDVPGLGATEIFLVPVERRGTAIAYEAVFN